MNPAEILNNNHNYEKKLKLFNIVGSILAIQTEIEDKRKTNGLYLVAAQCQ